MATAFEIVMDDRKKLVQKIINNMEKGYVIPPPLWNSGRTRPHNPVSKATYRGGNALKLFITQIENNYADSRWLTFKQATDNGWKIRTGAKSVLCEKWIFTKDIIEKDEITGESKKTTIELDTPKVSFFRVFNAQDIVGIPPSAEIPEIKYDDVMKLSDNLIASSECPVKTSINDQAFYRPSEDAIYLPDRSLFIDSKAYLGVAIHEMVHSTGPRLGRDMSGAFGSDSYAREELRAELGSFFLENDFGIKLENVHFNSHTQYLESWIKALKNDHNELFRACADADRAADRLLHNYEQYIQLTQEIEAEAEPEL